MFLNGEFKAGATEALKELQEAIASDAPQVVMSRVGVGVLYQLFIALDGLGRTYERLADGTEKLVEFAAVDINATIEQEVNRRADNIAQSAVDTYVKSSTDRSFIGKPT